MATSKHKSGVTCCLKVASQGGSLARHALFTVANLVLNLFKFSSSALIFPLESYSFITNLRAAVTDTSTSESTPFLLLLILEGHSLSGLPNCDITRIKNVSYELVP